MSKRRYYPQAQAFLARKTTQVNRTLAIKALANKLCRASYWVLKDQGEFERGSRSAPELCGQPGP